MATSIEGSSPATNPLDSFKNIIAEKVNALCGADLSLIHRSLEAPRSPDHGDFALAVPKLRIKGNPAALAKEWAGKVHIVV
jgi:arginyl-tRNA synthetase